MDIEPLAKVAQNYGIGLVLTLGMAYFVVWIIKYVLAHNEARESALTIIIKDNISLLSERIKTHAELNLAAAASLREYIHDAKLEREAQRLAYEQIKAENELRRQAQQAIVETLSALNNSFSTMNLVMINLNKNGK